MSKRIGALMLGGVLAAAVAADAAVTRLEIESRTPLAGGYELLSGRVFGEVDPKAPRNAIITDLALAPRNGRGRVEYSTTFAIAKPLDMARASGVLVYDVPNRGNARGLDGRDGHVHVVSGWQGDVPEAADRQTARVPVAPGVTGKVLARFVDFGPGKTTLPLAGGFGAPVPLVAPASLDTRKARLVRRRSDAAAVEPVAAGDWAFADCGKRAFPGAPDGRRVCVKGGFDPAYAYDLVYEGKDPPVLGLGFAAVRDLNAFLRHAPGPGNPLAGQIKHTVITGASQSGNFIRSFIRLGFNADEDGRIVFDGANPHIAARMVPLNVRFGVPGGAAGTYEPGSEGFVWWGAYDDKARGLGKGSLLDRCRTDRVCPKIVETFGAAEFWNLRMSPDLVGTDARADIPLPANVRRYYFPGATHGGGRGGFETAAAAPPVGCVLPANPNPETEELRAIRAALVDWVVTGKAPPPSAYPTLARGELVAANARAMGFPAIPGVPKPDGHLNTLPVQRFGPRFRAGDVSGIMDLVPPTLSGETPMLVPRVDADGNETAGAASVQMRAPLGTYLGWNETAAGYHKAEYCTLNGSFIPFARTKAERMAKGDPRLSLEERYGDHTGFVAKVKAAAADLQARGFLLAEDAQAIVRQAEDSAVLR